jgi:ATP-dependent DNA helicase DinG
MLDQDGALATVLSGYEVRPGQVEMLGAVVDVFCKDGILLVEAGTGVGKSLAYGLPAAAWAKASGERVVISSSTINLQEQLVNKDLPLLAKVLKKPLNVVLVKGRSNYLCRRRMATAFRQRDLLANDDNTATMQSISDWAESSNDGSRSDYPYRIDSNIWERICSDADACLGKKCTFRQDCFFVAAREKAEKAELLVVNHHLLFADMALRHQREDWKGRVVLPAFNRLVLDEAHDLEDAASSFFGVRITKLGVRRVLNKMWPKRKKQKSLLQTMIAELNRLADSRSSANGDQDLIKKELRESSEKYEFAFEGLMSFVKKLSVVSTGDIRLRLTKEVREQEEWNTVCDEFAQASRTTERLVNSVERIARRLETLSEEDWKVTEVIAWVERVRQLICSTEHFFVEGQDGFVRWARVGKNNQNLVSLQSAPLNASKLMNETLLDKIDTVVFTSATLSVNGSFDFLKERMGLTLQPKERLNTLMVESPFDYQNQVRLVIPDDLPTPDQPLFEQVLPGAVTRTIQHSGGRSLVLFTSWGLMSRVHDLIREQLELLGIEVYCQGEMPRDRLLTHFRNDETSVLLGTDSFWQGVDIIGPACSQIIIVRLPFDVPSEPLVQARMEAIEQGGKSSFSHFMLPRAVLKLKQGFGRLIRSQADRGAVIIFDTRLVSKKYGKMFIDSLPNASRIIGDLDFVSEELSQFFSKCGLD